MRHEEFGEREDRILVREKGGIVSIFKIQIKGGQIECRAYLHREGVLATVAICE